MRVDREMGDTGLRKIPPRGVPGPLKIPMVPGSIAI